MVAVSIAVSKLWLSLVCGRRSRTLGITWVIVVLGFFVWSMHYQLPPQWHPQNVYFSLYFYHFFIFTFNRKSSIWRWNSSSSTKMALPSRCSRPKEGWSRILTGAGSRFLQSSFYLVMPIFIETIYRRRSRPSKIIITRHLGQLTFRASLGEFCNLWHC